MTRRIGSGEALGRQRTAGADADAEYDADESVPRLQKNVKPCTNLVPTFRSAKMKF
jgi:hypothetical protein